MSPERLKPHTLQLRPAAKTQTLHCAIVLVSTEITRAFVMPEALLNGVHEHLVPHESRFGRLHVRPHDHLELVAMQVFH